MHNWTDFSSSDLPASPFPLLKSRRLESWVLPGISKGSEEKWVTFNRRNGWFSTGDSAKGLVLQAQTLLKSLDKRKCYIQKAGGGSIRSPSSLTWLDVLVTPMFTITMLSSFVVCMEGPSSMIKTAAWLCRQCRVNSSSHTGKALVIQGHKLNKTNLGPTCFSSSSL